MRHVRLIANRLRSVFRRNRQEEDLAHEISLHVDQLTKELVAGAMTPIEVRQTAPRQFCRVYHGFGVRIALGTTGMGIIRLVIGEIALVLLAAAAFLPALRASKVAPVEALRTE